MILKVESLALTLGERRLLADLSFSLASGQVLGMIGPNGSGKTTLLNVLCGFIEIQEGSLFLGDKCINRATSSQRARTGLGRTFQHSGIFKSLSVVDNIIVALEAKMPPLSLSLRGRKMRQALLHEATNILQKYSLLSHASRLAGTLSGGQLRLLEIARTVASGAKIILLDEPTAGVSPKMRGEVKHLLTDLKAEGLALLIVEHDMSFLEHLCDSVILLESGSIALQGTLTELRQDPRLIEIYFGT
jgi:ABC-type branched-subunit amino acid transport system ATPase component